MDRGASGRHLPAAQPHPASALVWDGLTGAPANSTASVRRVVIATVAPEVAYWVGRDERDWGKVVAADWMGRTFCADRAWLWRGR